MAMHLFETIYKVQNSRKIISKWSIVMPIKKLPILASFLMTLFFSSPSAFAIDEDGQLWTLVTATGNLTKDKTLRYFLEAQPRLGDDFSRLERLLVRGAIGYKVFENTYLWLGYGWTPTFINASYKSDFNNESRIWQQLTNDHKLGVFSISHRLRLEQRIIENQPETSHRIRYLFRSSLPLVSQESQVFGITGYDEIFLNLNSTTPGPESGFDRNRFFIGPYLTRENIRYELGYINEYSVRRNNEDRVINALLLSVNFNL